MDLTVLGPELVQLVAEIAPTSADEVRMRQFERVANDAPPLGENEQFLLAVRYNCNGTFEKIQI